LLRLLPPSTSKAQKTHKQNSLQLQQLSAQSNHLPSPPNPATKQKHGRKLRHRSAGQEDEDARKSEAAAQTDMPMNSSPPNSRQLKVSPGF
jgi:hypothetical protein